MESARADDHVFHTPRLRANPNPIDPRRRIQKSTGIEAIERNLLVIGTRATSRVGFREILDFSPIATRYSRAINRRRRKGATLVAALMRTYAGVAYLLARCALTRCGSLGAPPLYNVGVSQDYLFIIPSRLCNLSWLRAERWAFSFNSVNGSFPICNWEVPPPYNLAVRAVAGPWSSTGMGK